MGGEVVDTPMHTMKCQILYLNGSSIIFWRQTQKSHIFSQTLHKKFNVGVHIDNNPIFESHVRFLYKKASQNLDALARIAYSLKFGRRKLLLHAFITSQFSYASIVWMFYNRKLNNHIRLNKIIQRLMNLLQKTIPSKFMPEIYINYLLT